jgi:uncharacterized repeat protein (TIGR03803 family)
MQHRILGTSQCLILAIVTLSIASAVQAQSYKFSTLYSFKNNGTDPSASFAPLIIDAAGNLYGTSSNGGDFGLGTVFKVTKNGALSVLHSFQGSPNDGEFPETGLARDSAGNLYGTTYPGGTAGCGVVFKLTPAGQENILHNFTCGADGDTPGKLVRDSAGNLFGTAQDGVNSSGLVFKIDASNAFSVFYSFCSLPGCADGGDPNDLIMDKSGNLYGTNVSGGLCVCGTVYKITPAGVLSVLYSFVGGPTDGQEPGSSVTRDAAGNLYGTTFFGGTHDEGTLYVVPQAGGTDTILYNFCSVPRCKDGKLPIGRVQLDQTGNVYGITQQSAQNAGSVVWEVNTAGKEIVLFTFARKEENFGGLTIDSKGNLYGATVSGGTNRLGSVYKLTLVK